MFFSILFFITTTLSTPLSISPLLSTNVTERLSISADRTYYIAAIEIYHSYAPNGINPFDKLPVDESPTASVFTKTGIDRIGKVYKKAVYREYTDESFTIQVNRTDSIKYLSILGPIIRATVGDRIKIVFKNMCQYNYSMHPHGVKYDKSSEGAKYIDNDNTYSYLGDSVAPGKIWVYFWDVRQESGGSYNELSSKFWMYHSHVAEPEDTNSGLVGPIIITKKGKYKSLTNLSPIDVDKEFITLFTVFDENKSHYLKENVFKFATNYINQSMDNLTNYNILINDDDFIESNLMHSMNGLTWGTLGQYYTNIIMGERVRWYVGALGTEVDLHSVHWHGNTVFYNGRIEDVTQVIPAITQTVDMIPDVAGTWVYHCHVNDHIEAGMVATYTVLNRTRNTIRTTPMDPVVAAFDTAMDQIDMINEKMILDDNNNQEWDMYKVLAVSGIAAAINFVAILFIGFIYCACQQRKNEKKKQLHEHEEQLLSEMPETNQYENPDIGNL